MAGRRTFLVSGMFLARSVEDNRGRRLARHTHEVNFTSLSNRFVDRIIDLMVFIVFSVLYFKHDHIYIIYLFICTRLFMTCRHYRTVMSTSHESPCIFYEAINWNDVHWLKTALSFGPTTLLHSRVGTGQLPKMFKIFLIRGRGQSSESWYLKLPAKFLSQLLSSVFLG
jgi:uncharacterized protein (DUF486 family)